ncbi:ribosome biogenesis BMS1 homolog [Paramuricea clavata]|uniref:Ribosome biogenesis BMS1 homolog n=1 Tax=Paramuricea clavata TaxID=317549 RepID=A0A7D9ERG4_PARCT|nr:ribosome biogenesis BMS1 homolog [Paramuricea clavata]
MQETIDAKMASSKLSLFKDSLPLGQEEVDSWKLPSEEVVHESGRVRRRATWEDDDNVDDGNDDGEEDDYGDDDAGDSDDEDRDDQSSDIEKSDKTRNEKIKLNKTTKNESLVYEEEDSDACGDNESDVDEDEHVNLDDVSDNDSDASTDDLPCSSSQVKPNKRKVPSSSEEPCSDSKKTKKKKLSRSNDGEITDVKSGTAEQESVDESAWGKQYWSKNLMEKAREAYLRHQNNTPNLKKLIYGQGASRNSTAENESEDSDEGAVGGLFRMKNQTKNVKDQVMHERDSSKIIVQDTREWQEILADIKDCFVTGKWTETEDAEALLQLDDQDDEEIFGDFEDLETGEVHRGDNVEKDDECGDERSDDADRDEENEKQEIEERIEKKKKLKASFDVQYDDGEESTYYDDLKAQMTEQARLNQEEFEGMDDETRIQYEGYRAGMYIRLEVEKIPCEFINNFNPTYPVVLGGLLSNEDNIGYIRVS